VGRAAARRAALEDVWKVLTVEVAQVGEVSVCSNFLYVFKAARNGPLTPPPKAHV
jgi:hypothetical protein